MSVTLTKKEFDRIYNKVNTAFVSAVYDYYKKNKFGMEVCDKDELNIQKLFVYLMSLASYQTAAFTDSYFENCITKEQVYNIFASIKKIS